MYNLSGKTLAPYQELHNFLVQAFKLPASTNLVTTDRRGDFKRARRAFTYYVKNTADETNEYIAVILNVSTTALFAYTKDWMKDERFEEIDNAIIPYLPGYED